MIPKYNEFYPKVLSVLKDGKSTSLQEIYDYICSFFQFTEEEKNMLTKAGNATIVKDRIWWALTYLSQAELIERESKGVYKITELGTQWLLKFPADSLSLNNHVFTLISKKFQRFNYRHTEPFQVLNINDFSLDLLKEIKENGIKKYRVEQPSLSEEKEGDSEIDQDDPETNIINTYETYKKKMIVEIQTLFLSCNEYKFEELALRVLEQCGYGTSEYNQTTQKSRDKGLDGLISEDKLGLSTIGLQVKRYQLENHISSREINSFIGALSRAGLSKGFFITSSSFTKDAQEASKDHKSYSLVLIDGYKLAELLFETELGLKTKQIMKIIHIDEEFFEYYQS